MAFIADTLSRIKPSPTIAVSSKAAELKAAGHDVIGLGAGEPDFNTPDHIKQAGVNAINNNKSRYTAVDGTAELKDAICYKFKRDNGLDYKRSQISVNSGGKHTIYNALMATINLLDEVIIPTPYWVSYPEMVKLADGKPVILRTSFEDHYKLTPDQLENAITANTKALILCSPSNPTGSCYTWDELNALADVLLKYPQIYVISDEIYEYISFEQPHFSIGQVQPKIIPQLLLINGFSKGFACRTSTPF